MLETSHLHFSYNHGPSFAFPDIQCGSGEHLLIIGESGKGKTTLLHVLAGLLTPGSGTLKLNGRDMGGLSGRELDRFRGEHIGMVFQTAHFVESLSVEDNLLLPHFLTNRSLPRERVKKLLEHLQLGGKAHKKPSTLSVGEQQRVAIARAVIHSPALILADEPTSALDDRNASQVISLLEEQASATGSALVIVTHDKRLKERFPNSVAL